LKFIWNEKAKKSYLFSVTNQDATYAVKVLNKPMPDNLISNNLKIQQSENKKSHSPFGNGINL